MNGNVILALLILAYLIAFCVYLVADVNNLCDEQIEQDELWNDGYPSAETLEAGQPSWGAEAS